MTMERPLQMHAVRKPRNVFTIPDRYHITYASSDAAAGDFPRPVVRLTKTSFLSSTIFPIPDLFAVRLLHLLIICEI